eukprot:scaffold172931_cov26-Prasinocladus_malaysianus.AAC.1
MADHQQLWTHAIHSFSFPTLLPTPDITVVGINTGKTSFPLVSSPDSHHRLHVCKDSLTHCLVCQLIFVGRKCWSQMKQRPVRLQ